MKLVAIPYAFGINESLCRIFNDYNVKLRHVPTSKLRQQLVQVKGAPQRARYPGMVHKISREARDAAYIRETGNYRWRLKEHKNSVANRRAESNALAERATITGHLIAWDSARIIATERTLSTRLLLESFLVH